MHALRCHVAVGLLAPCNSQSHDCPPDQRRVFLKINVAPYLDFKSFTRNLAGFTHEGCHLRWWLCLASLRNPA